MSYAHTASDVLLVGIVITVNETDLASFLFFFLSPQSCGNVFTTTFKWMELIFYLFFFFYSSKAPLRTARIYCFYVSSTNRKYCDILYSKFTMFSERQNASCWLLELSVELNGALKEIHVPVKAFSNLQILVITTIEV